MSLVLDPFPQPELVLGRPKEPRNLFGMLMALEITISNLVFPTKIFNRNKAAESH